MSAAVITQVVCALREQVNGDDSNPTVTILITHGAVVILMGKLFFHAQILPEEDDCT